MRKNRKGFSLGEILVAVAIVAVIAAVVLPSISGSLTKGDTSRVESDLASMQTGAQQFLADVRRYPAALSQLLKAISASDKDLVNNTSYNATQIARWRGPYLTKDSAGVVNTGYYSIISPTFQKQTFNGSSWLTIFVTIDSASAVDIDKAMDDGVFNTGVVQWTGGSMKFFAIPIQ
ncbi:MAG TPA: prepilin-type N-terminal cleavage/methylation domain-containing protein [Gemmatimonadaceae bacterium]|jgi:prepilin-type N-terminal cleavage/methylation domain-containing protein